MDIGFDISTLALPRTGIGQYQYNLLNALLKIDKENQYHLYGFNFRKFQNLKSLKFDSDNLDINAIRFPQRLVTAWWNICPWPKLENITKKCDIYQVSEICQQPTKAKTVSFIHDMTTHLFPNFHLKKNKLLYEFKFKKIKKCADAILTNSEHTKRDVIEHLQIPEERIHVTPLGVNVRFKKIDDTEKIAEILHHHNIYGPYILFIGTLEPRKNIPSILQSLYELKKYEKIPHKLVIVGKVGWKHKEIIDLIMELDLQKEVILTGFIPDEDLPYILNGADLFIYPSFYEGFGLPVLEAMACGTPVITSNVSSLPEVGGDAVVYIDPYNYQHLSREIYEILKSKDKRSLLSAKGLERAKAFTWENCARKTLNVYNSLK